MTTKTYPASGEVRKGERSSQKLPRTEKGPDATALPQIDSIRGGRFHG